MKCATVASITQFLATQLNSTQFNSTQLRPSVTQFWGKIELSNCNSGSRCLVSKWHVNVNTCNIALRQWTEGLARQTLRLHLLPRDSANLPSLVRRYLHFHFTRLASVRLFVMKTMNWTLGYVLAVTTSLRMSPSTNMSSTWQHHPSVSMTLLHGGEVIRQPSLS